MQNFSEYKLCDEDGKEKQTIYINMDNVNYITHFKGDVYMFKLACGIELYCKPTHKSIPLPLDCELSQKEITNNKYVKVWAFEEAPKEYREMSGNGGDEDWIAFIPDSMHDYYFAWLEEGTSFGCCCVDKYKVNGGWIRIGSHA